MEQTHADYMSVVERLTAIRKDKVRQYGTKRYEIADTETNLWMCYSDVYRKFIRLEEQLDRRDIKGMVETYSDMANYCIMAIQILEKIDEKV